MKAENNFHIKNLIVPFVVLLAFWGIAIWGFVASGYIQPIIMFGYIGTSLGVGLGLYETLPKQKKPIGRRLTLFLVGLFLIGFAIFMGHENVQIEGAIFGLLTGVIQMGVIHYMIAKIVDPLSPLYTQPRHCSVAYLRVRFPCRRNRDPRRNLVHHR